MCDRISIILKGQVIARGTVEQLRELAARGTESSDRSANDEHLTEVFLRLTGGSGLQEIDEVL
jgi:ABC-type multidrug transport system ATPase subunit